MAMEKSDMGLILTSLVFDKILKNYPYIYIGITGPPHGYHLFQWINIISTILAEGHPRDKKLFSNRPSSF